MVKKFFKQGVSLLLVGGLIVGSQSVTANAFSGGILGSYSTESFSSQSANGYVSSSQKTYLSTTVKGYYYGSGGKLVYEKNHFDLTSTGCGCGVSAPSNHSFVSADYTYVVSSTTYRESAN